MKRITKPLQKSKFDKLMLQKCEQKLKEYQKGFEVFNLEYEQSFYKNRNIKKFYSFVKFKPKCFFSLSY